MKKIGDIMEVGFSRPRVRHNLLETKEYYGYREQLLDFLERYEKIKPFQKPEKGTSPRNLKSLTGGGFKNLIQIWK